MDQRIIDELDAAMRQDVKAARAPLFGFLVLCLGIGALCVAGLWRSGYLGY
jgi:hypothetical protein